MGRSSLRSRLLELALALACLGWLSPAAAAPPSKAACSASHGKAQEFRLDNKLLDARNELRVCADPACPSLLQSECGNWLMMVQQAIPSVILLVESEGRVTDRASVVLDGQPLSLQPNEAYELDPGAHTFRVELEGYPAIEQTYVIRQDEKRRVLRVQFTKAEAADTASRAPSAAPAAGTGANAPESQRSGPRPIPLTSYLFGGVAIAAAGVGTYFAISGVSKYKDDKDGCAPNCGQSEVDAVKSKLLLADVGLGVGIASAALAAYFYLTRPVVGGDTAAAQWSRRLGVSARRGGAGLSLQGSF